MKQLITIFLFFFPALIIAQTITGKVADKTEAIPYANVVITDANQKIITGTTTDDTGFFSLKVKAGTYKLTVSFIGYKNVTREVNLTKDIHLGTILISESEALLDEVVIQFTKRILERKIDRLVFNVSQSIAATGGNGVDILKITPGVQLQNGTIQILGKGASRVLINDRISPLQGDELVSFLSGLNANDIEKIEVITNPPAKYEAAGNGGLINIVLKKGVQNSWRNSSTLTYNQNSYNFTTLTNNFFYNKNRISFSANLNASKGSFENNEGLQIHYPNNFWDIDVRSKMGKDQFSGRFLVDYALSAKTTFGLQYLTTSNTPKDLGTTISSIFDANNNLEKKLINTGVNNVNTKNHTLNFHLITQLDSLGKRISLDADYFTLNSKRDRDFVTESYFANGNFEGLNSAAINNANQKIENFSTKLDVDLPLKKIHVSFGAKASFTKSLSDVFYYNTISGTAVLDASRSNKFTYHEDNLAAYVSGNTQLTNKLQMQFGLRLENSKTEGLSTQVNQTNANEYTKLFPTLYFSYTKNDYHNFGFTYGRRINRPNFTHLNPFRYYINDKSYSVGNPFLQPTFSDNFEFSHVYKNKFHTSVFVNYISNGFGTVFTSDIANQTQIITRENYFTQYNYGITESFSYAKVSWWKSQNSINLLGYQTRFIKDFGSQPKNGMRLYLTSNNTFTLAENTKLQLNSWYSSKHNSGLYSLGEMFDLSFGLEHHFKKSNVKMSLFFNDVLNTTSLNNYVSTVNGVEQVYKQNESSRNFRLSLSYDFGNKKVQVKNRDFGNDDELRRSH
ncbi:TonB-dependent receptor [Polaribacter pacificus]|uniref:TonB-dependent receptor n=1 Tax=Polaribacter pacificus TaxID=1775173 RepID=A0A917HWI0_9FLAO|nr:TonB-dependent receptor [Polaribacter pacificus]GGG92158.1 TonB-dependent receptor [Polaribacter pacificus]